MKVLNGIYGVGSLGFKFASYYRTIKKFANGSESLTRETRDRLMPEFAADLLKTFSVNDYCNTAPKIDRPSILVGNHISYLDIPLIAKHCPATFVAKEEVNSWPIFGKINKQMRTIPLNRNDRKSRNKVAEQIARKIKEQKDSILLFPAGTTSITKGILWKRGSFNIAHKNNIPIIPFRIQYSPLRRAAFIGDDYLLPHIFRLSYHGKLEAYLEFSKPIMITDVEKQLKEVRTWCQEPFLEAKANPITV